MPGCLWSVRRNGKQNYLKAQIIDGKCKRHGISRDPDTLRHLCRKAYLKEALQAVSSNIQCLTGAKSQYLSLDPEEIIPNLPQVYRTLPVKYFFPDSRTGFPEDLMSDGTSGSAGVAAKVKAWCEEPYEQSDYMPDKKIHTTSRGENKRKMEIYETAGIVPWDNLIVTYGDINGNIDVRAIESELRSKLL